MDCKIIWNLPNLISASRLAFTPFILYLTFFISKEYFAYIFLVFQFTDILDGYIAKRFSMSTDFGALLDTWGDLCSYLIAFHALFFYHPDFFLNSKLNIFLVSIFLALYFINALLIFIMHKKICFGLSTKLSKICFYLQSGFLIFTFLYSLNLYFFYIAFLIGIIRELENGYLIINKKTKL